jgi:hypothetical protein
LTDVDREILVRWNSLSDRQNLTRTHELLRQISVQLKILATLIDNYPYGLNKTGYQCFERNQTDYQRCAAQYQCVAQPTSVEIETKDTKETAQSLLQSCQQLDTYLAERLSLAIIALNDELLKDSLRSLQQSLRSMTVKLDAADTSDRKTQGVNTEDADCKANIARTLEALKNRVNGLKQGLLKGSSFKTFKNSRFYLSLEIKAPEFLVAKQHQHTIVALRTRINDVQALCGTSSAITPLSTDRWLRLEDYADILLVAHIIKPTEILSALDNQKQVLAAAYTEVREKIQWLQNPGHLGKKFREVLRQQRIRWLYERWQETLNRLSTSLTASSNSWKSQVARQSALTYEKKRAFQQLLKQQPVSILVSRLYRSEQAQPLSAELRIVQLRVDIQTLRIAIIRQEKSLLARDSVWRQMAATVLLSLTQQPEFQLGQVASSFTARQLDQYSPIAALREPLPEPLAKQLQHAVGFAFLGIGLSVSNYVGYSYHGIAVINRALSAQITSLSRISCEADRLIQRTVIPLLEQCEKITGTDKLIWEWLKQAVRWDEIGFLEKESVWHWLTGLGMSVAFTPGQPVLATTLAYGLATAASHAMVSLIDYGAPYWDVSPEMVSMAQVAFHMTIYTLAYRQGFQWAHQLGLMPENVMSQAEALKTLGLTTGVSERQMKQRYRELAKQFHPDKCPTAECANAMIQVNAAQAVLIKKMQ